LKAYTNIMLTLGVISTGVGVYLYMSSLKNNKSVFSSRCASINPTKIKKTINNSADTITETMIRPVKSAVKTFGKLLENFADM